MDENELVCYKKFNRGKLLKLIVIPQKLRHSIISDVHNSVYKGCHSGVARTYAKLSNFYFWPNLYRDIKNYVQTCHACQVAKKSKIRYGKITPSFEKDNRIFYQINSDMVGPFKYGGRDIYVLTAICNFSKFLIMRAYYKVSAETVIAFLDEIISIFPCPRIFKTDNGSIFENNKVRAYCEAMGITLRHSLKYSPSTNAIVERCHQNLSSGLKTLIEGLKTHEIFRTIRMIMRVYNTTPSRQLDGYSPCAIVFSEEDRWLELKYDIPTPNIAVKSERKKSKR